ncbi:aldo/keto reductase [Komagataeibacter melomenusus]|uniref:aldo/keto reductase n=1 Tax=Komagataeibacter TaxID=1434011 RepID=UPI0027E00A47|nr:MULTISPECIES: aldo/keto reductase [Komagataeibacter]
MAYQAHKTVRTDGSTSFSPIQSDALTRVATDIGGTPLQVALAWLLARSPNLLLIPGTSNPLHLSENLAAATLELSADVQAQLDTIAIA